MEPDERHQPPSPSAVPRRPSLKRDCSTPKMSSSPSLNDDEVELVDSRSVDSGEPMLSEDSRKRRASFSDENGMELRTIHHGAARRIATRLCARCRSAASVRDVPSRTPPRHTTVPRCSPLSRAAARRAAVHDTHYKRTFWRRHRYEIWCGLWTMTCCGGIVAIIVSLVP